MPPNSLRFLRTSPYLGDVELVTIDAPIGTLTANTTTVFSLGAMPGFTAWIVSACISAGTVPADADGTILGTLNKWDASADAAVALASAVDLEALVADEATAITITATLTQDQVLLDTGDTIYFSVVNNSGAINTQPANCRVRVMLAIRKQQ